jgi:hypothetical protein
MTEEVAWFPVDCLMATSGRRGWRRGMDAVLTLRWQLYAIIDGLPQVAGPARVRVGAGDGVVSWYGAFYLPELCADMAINTCCLGRY